MPNSDNQRGERKFYLQSTGPRIPVGFIVTANPNRRTISSPSLFDNMPIVLQNNKKNVLSKSIYMLVNNYFDTVQNCMFCLSLVIVISRQFEVGPIDKIKFNSSKK
jgi:hypothetical protein